MNRVRHCGDGGELARNMSAPPRVTLNFTALMPAPADQGDPVGAGAGLQFVCRLDVGRFMKAYRRGAVRWGIVRTRSLEGYLRVAYPHARAEVEGRKHPTREAHVHACTAPVEALADGLRDLVTTVSLSAAGLPAFGLLVPTHGIGHVPEASLCKTIAILARRRGSIFLRESDPIVWSAMSCEALDLWLPVSAKTRPA